MKRVLRRLKHLTAARPESAPAEVRPGALMKKFQHDGERPDTGHAPTAMETAFWSNDGPAVNKWHHYLPVYERHFAELRGKPFRMLEIGVNHGGSLEMWRRYFGPECTLFGIDIQPACATLDGRSGQVRIGSQDDPAFLRSVVEEMGGVDVVLDDGSHRSDHMRTSFQTLYPLLSEGGLYVIEDLHAAYWPNFAGGYDAPTSFMADLKRIIDDMHHWYHLHGVVVPETNRQCAGLHFYDSVVVIEKQHVPEPRHSRRGSELLPKLAEAAS